MHLCARQKRVELFVGQRTIVLLRMMSKQQIEMHCIMTSRQITITNHSLRNKTEKQFSHRPRVNTFFFSRLFQGFFQTFNTFNTYKNFKILKTFQTLKTFKTLKTLNFKTFKTFKIFKILQNFKTLKAFKTIKTFKAFMRCPNFSR